MKNTLIIALFLSLLLGCQSETKRMDQYEVHGIDISHHQKQIDWEEVAKSKVQFAFVKASEGENFQDSLFCTNWQSLKEVGIRRGAYHFFRPKKSGLFQAQNFITDVKLEAGDMPPVLDVEVLDGVSSTVLVNRMKSWLNIIESHYRIKPIIYTNLKFYHQHLIGSFEDYPIWIARYSYRKPFFLDGRTWAFWQYGNKGQLEGIKGDVDFNVFYGTEADMEALCYKKPSLVSFNE